MIQQQHSFSVSVVIPTCNRKRRLLSLLQNLADSSYPLLEVIIIDSGEDRLSPDDYAMFRNFPVTYMASEKSVCIQRNIGIANSKGEWIFLCDDDVEVPVDYIQKLVNHLEQNKDAGAVSGLFLQTYNDKWEDKYSITSAALTSWNFIFKLSIWGEVNCKDNLFITGIKKYYKQKRNHISKAGWPVVTDFSGDYFESPLYSLGASLVRRQWLIRSPFDEVLDPHGIGDNYGVAFGFPSKIHVLNSAWVYHHRVPENRLQKSLQYYRRTLALDYFRRTKQNFYDVKKIWLLWSLFGNLLMFAYMRNSLMLKASFKLIRIISLNKNPYYWGALNKEKVVRPTL